MIKSQRLYYVALLLVLFIWPLAKIQAQPESPEDNQQAFLLFQKAQSAFGNEQYRECIDLCREAESYAQRDKWIYQLNALACAACGEKDQAIEAFKTALNIDYTFFQCRNNLGMFHMRLGNLAEAKQSFQDCIKIAPKYPFAHYNLGQILQKQGDLDGAIEEYETATRLKPDYFEAQRDLGLAIYERASSGLTDIADCEDRLKIAAKLAPQNPMIHYHLGTIYCSNGKLDDAEKEFKTALAYDQQLAAAHFEYGQLRYFRGDPDRCLAELNVALKINPAYSEGKSYPAVDIAKVKLIMAKCFEAKDNIKQAISFWQDVAAMTKNNKDLLKHIAKLEKQGVSASKHRLKADCQGSAAQSLLIKGITQSDSGELDAAKATFTIMTRDYPGCFEAWQNYGAVEEQTGNLQAATADYKQAIELAPEYDGLYYNLANLLEKMGLIADAGAMYAHFHEIAGRFPYDSKHIVALEQEYARQQAKIHK